MALSRNDAVATVRGCGAPPQSVGATPSSHDEVRTPFGSHAFTGDEASPTPAATGASQPRAACQQPSTAWFRLS